MTISELIEELEKFKLDSEIKFFSYIETGRGGSWIEVEDCDLEEEEGVVMLKVSGDEDEDGGYD